MENWHGKKMACVGGEGKEKRWFRRWRHGERSFWKASGTRPLSSMVHRISWIKGDLNWSCSEWLGFLQPCFFFERLIFYCNGNCDAGVHTSAACDDRKSRILRREGEEKHVVRDGMKSLVGRVDDCVGWEREVVVRHASIGASWGSQVVGPAIIHPEGICHISIAYLPPNYECFFFFRRMRDGIIYPLLLLTLGPLPFSRRRWRKFLWKKFHCNLNL